MSGGGGDGCGALGWFAAIIFFIALGINGEGGAAAFGWFAAGVMIIITYFAIAIPLGVRKKWQDQMDEAKRKREEEAERYRLREELKVKVQEQERLHRVQQMEIAAEARRTVEAAKEARRPGRDRLRKNAISEALAALAQRLE